MRQWAPLGVAIAMIVALVGARSWLSEMQRIPLAVTTIEVEPGQSGHSVALSLAPSLSRFDRALLFRVFPQLAEVKAGQYAFASNLSLVDALRAVSDGDSVVHRFTIPEGLTVAEIVSRLQTTDGVSASDMSPGDLLALLDPPFQHPEGAFLAETYLWKSERAPTEILSLAHRALQDALEAAWMARTEAVDAVLTSPYELLILASIVEKETALALERPRVAGVFIERLRRGMRLQTDPTVIYGLGDRFDGNLTRAHLRELTPYNTYRIDGLPPTPIAVVGPEALLAVARPEITGELYFVADGKGGHVFARTLEEHNDNVRKYQLKR